MTFVHMKCIIKALVKTIKCKNVGSTIRKLHFDFSTKNYAVATLCHHMSVPILATNYRIVFLCSYLAQATGRPLLY